jgi:SAM-dependent methyltransferase
LQYQDIDCPFKLFKKESLSQCNLNYIRNRDSIINTELLTQLKFNKAKILEAPVSQLPGGLEYHNRIGVDLIIRVFFKLVGLRLRFYFQALIGYFGFVTGLFSRTDRPMEMIIFRQSELCLSDSQINCRICGADEKSLRRTNLHTCEDAQDLGDFAVYFCTSCQNAFTYPVISEDNIFLQPDVPFEKMTNLQQKMISWFMDIRRKRVVFASEGTKKEELLDIGGGNHGFGNMMARNGWKVTVLEPNPKNAGYADISLGVKTITNTFSNNLVLTGVLKEEEFDLITLWHSLEHLKEVSESLELINKLLKPGGCLYISVPNLNSLQADLGRNRWAYLDVPHHLSHFTLDGLVQLLNKNGFSQMNIHWTSPEYEVFGFYQTLLNVISLSHNYYYHLNKKGRKTDQSLKYPFLTKTVTSLGFIWLPLAFILSMFASLTGKPACVEIHCYKSSSSSR